MLRFGHHVPSREYCITVLTVNCHFNFHHLHLEILLNLNEYNQHKLHWQSNLVTAVASITMCYPWWICSVGITEISQTQGKRAAPGKTFHLPGNPFCISRPVSNSQTRLSNPQDHLPINLLVYCEIKKSGWTPRHSEYKCIVSAKLMGRNLLSRALTPRITAVGYQACWFFKKGRVKTEKEKNTGFDEAGLYFLSGIQFQFQAERTLWA